MSRFSPLFFLSLLSFSLSVHADLGDRSLKMVCESADNADLKRLEIRETDLVGQLYFREVYRTQPESSQDLYTMFNWSSILNNTMPTISQGRTVERVKGENNLVRWTIGGKPAVCVDANEYRSKDSSNESTSAKDPTLKVECQVDTNDELRKIEIREEMSLPGSYYIVEHFRDGAGTRTNTIYSYFGDETLKPEDKKTQEQIERTRFPELTSWNGYKRTLHRASENYWYLGTYDQCGGFDLGLTCKVY